jgi:hypothetical protein
MSLSLESGLLVFTFIAVQVVAWGVVDMVYFTKAIWLVFKGWVSWEEWSSNRWRCMPGTGYALWKKYGGRRYHD